MSYIPDPLKDPEYYNNLKAIMEPLKESFRWIVPEFRTAHAGKNSIKIKGVALRGDQISLNKRVYIEEELKRAARTFFNKPITVNHADPSIKSNIIGNIDWMEYEDGCMEYLATIKKQPYVDLLRSKSTDILGVSIEADYLRNQCPKCGEHFTDTELFRNHMNDKHFIKFPKSIVHGIIGKSLSLVLSPEQPGVGGTTIELMEKKGLNCLFEMITKDKGVKEMKIGEPLAKYTNKEDCETGGGTWDTETQTCKASSQPTEETTTAFVPDPLTSKGDVEDDAAAKDEGKNPPTHPVTLPTEGPPPKKDKADTEEDTEPEELKPVIDEVPLTIGELSKAVREISKKVRELSNIKHVFEKLLAEADKGAEARDTTIKTLEMRVKELAEDLEFKSSKLKDARTKISETTNLEEQIQKLSNKYDNLEDKLKPQFKGYSKRLTESSDKKDQPFIEDPLIKKKKK